MHRIPTGLYVERDLLLAVGYFAASTLGAFIGGYLSFWLLPDSGTFGIVWGSLLLVILCVVVWHRARKDKGRERY